MYINLNRDIAVFFVVGLWLQSSLPCLLFRFFFICLGWLFLPEPSLVCFPISFGCFSFCFIFVVFFCGVSFLGFPHG